MIRFERQQRQWKVHWPDNGDGVTRWVTAPDPVTALGHLLLANGWMLGLEFDWPDPFEESDSE